MSDPPAGSVRRLRLAAAALGSVLAVALAAFFYHYLTHIPEARSPGPDAAITVPVGRDLLFDGLNAGNVFTLAIRDARQVSLTLPPTARLVESTSAADASTPVADETAQPGLGGRRLVTAEMPAGSVVEISFAVAGERPGLLFTPARPAGGQRDFRVRMRRGQLRVRVEFRENSAGEGRMILAEAHAARHLNAVEFLIPAPATPSQSRANSLVNLSVLGLGAYGADLPEDRRGLPAIVELPIVQEDEPDRPRLALGAVATGRDEAGNFVFDTIACATGEGRTRLWRSPLPAIRLDRCAPGRLSVDRFDPFAAERQLFVVDGTAFFAGIGAPGPEYWGGPSGILGNSIISVVFGGLVGSLITGAGLRMKRALGGNPPKPDGNEEAAGRPRRSRSRKR